MARLVVRQDPVELTGKMVSFIAPLFDPQDASPIRTWTFIVEPDPPYKTLLTTRNGVNNAGGKITCSVNTDERVIGWVQLLPLLSNAYLQKVRIVGTWCDDDDAFSTVICPLGILVVQYKLEIYDVKDWPVAVRDYDLFAFAHASSNGISDANEPHAGESQTFAIHLPFPFSPSNTATPFARPYISTRLDFADSATFIIGGVADTPQLDVTIETGMHANGKGFFAIQVGLTFDEPDLDNFCPLGTCDLNGEHCAHRGDFRYMHFPAHVSIAKKGDLVLSPGNGEGFISGIVASLNPAQVYDHMGIFVDNGFTIRHCTSSFERIQDEQLFTKELSVKVAGLIELENEKIPLEGLRPDLVRFGWPGSITQTVGEVYESGRNSLNQQWSFAATHPGQDVEDPEEPGKPFRIYHLPRAERQRRLQFNDPELDKGEWIVRLQEAPVRLIDVWASCPQDTAVPISNSLLMFTPRLVRPHKQFDNHVRPALELVADMALKIKAHYRFFAYSKGDISLDPAFAAPQKNDPSWGTLPNGARWAARTIPAMCSSFVWTAVQLANRNRPGSMLPIILEDKVDPPNPLCGLEYGSKDGFYQYHTDEQHKAGDRLVNKIMNLIFKRFDDQIPKAAYATLPSLNTIRLETATRVANQIANTFALDAAERLDDAWRRVGDGNTASPDDILKFWDLKPIDGGLRQPQDGLAIYGDSEIIQMTKPGWARIPLFRKQDIELGTGKVTAIVKLVGEAIEGATIKFDFGCVSVTSTINPETAVIVDLGAGTHFAEAFMVLPNPVTGNPETFQTPQPLQFEIVRGQLSRIELNLEPPSDLWRVIDIQLDADIHDRSFWGGDADAKVCHILPEDPNWQLKVQQDLNDDPKAPEDQKNTCLTDQKVWLSEPAVGSGVHVTLIIDAELNPADRSVKCHCVISLIDTDNGIEGSFEVDQQEIHDRVILPDTSVDILSDAEFSSDETVREFAKISLRLTNRRRPS